VSPYRGVTVLARCAVLAARPPTLPARRPPTAHAPYGRPARPPAALQTTTDNDDRRQPAKQYWPIRRASNNDCYAVCLAINGLFRGQNGMP